MGTIDGRATIQFLPDSAPKTAKQLTGWAGHIDPGCPELVDVTASLIRLYMGSRASFYSTVASPISLSFWIKECPHICWVAYTRSTRRQWHAKNASGTRVRVDLD